MQREMLASFFKECVTTGRIDGDVKRKRKASRSRGEEVDEGEIENEQHVRTKVLGQRISDVPLLASKASELHITLKKGLPYDLWKIVELASSSTGSQLKLSKSIQFHPTDFPGYAHRRTIGFRIGNCENNEEVLEKGSTTYIFQRAW